MLKCVIHVMHAGAIGAEGDVAAAAEVAEGWPPVLAVTGVSVLQEAGVHVVLPEGSVLAVPCGALHSGTPAFENFLF